MKTVIILGAGILTFILLVSKESMRRLLLFLGLFSIVLGHRSIYLGKESYFVPLEIIFFVLFFYMFLLSIIRGEPGGKKIPGFLIFVTFWAIFRGMVGLLEGENWDSILAWTFPLVLGVPVFWVIRQLIQNFDHFLTALKILFGVSIIMSVLALVEYYYPSISTYFPFIFQGSYILTTDGFVRASFSFWGYPAGAIIVTWGMFIAYQGIIDSPNRNWSLLWVTGFLILQGMAVYISGQRSSWLGVVIALVLLSLRGKAKGVAGIISIFAIANVLPAVFWQRFDTVTNYVEYGVISDSSINSRLLRWQWGWAKTAQYPILGGGYDHWLVHNIFLEISSTIGIIAAIAFLIFLIQLIFRVSRSALNGATQAERRYGWLFLAIAITWVIQLNVETAFQTPALTVAFWPYMALAWYLPEIINVQYPVKQQNYLPRRTLNAYRFYPHV